MKKTFLLLIACLAMSTAITSCKKNNDSGVSSEEQKLVGTWRLHDDYSAHYGTGWTDEMTLKSDHTFTWDRWFDAWGETVEHTYGTWSYNSKSLEFNRKGGGGWNGNYNYTDYVIKLTDTELELANFSGDMTYWKKQDDNISTVLNGTKWVYTESGWFYGNYTNGMYSTITDILTFRGNDVEYRHEQETTTYSYWSDPQTDSHVDSYVLSYTYYSDGTGKIGSVDFSVSGNSLTYDGQTYYKRQ